MGIFFESWQLWEEMTFVLACAIIIVFLIGLGKLWWTNRLLRRREQMDIEKRARTDEMRRVGLSPHKKHVDEIPFGARAIQCGVEVEGIWISHPPATSPDLVANTTDAVANDDQRENGSKQQKYTPVPIEDDADQITPQQHAPTSPKEAPDAADPYSGPAAPLPQMSEDTEFLPNSRNVPVRIGLLNEEALRRLGGQSSSSETTRLTQTTEYVSSSGQNIVPPKQVHPAEQQYRAPVVSHYRPSQQIPPSVPEKIRSLCRTNGIRRSSTASSISSRSSSSSSTTSRPSGEGFPTTDAAAAADAKEEDCRLYSSMNGVRMPIGPYSQHPALRTKPQRIGPGDSFANRAARRVNSAFEVLPAGTFGGPPTNTTTGTQDDTKDASERRKSWIHAIQPARNKLRKSVHS